MKQIKKQNLINNPIKSAIVIILGIFLIVFKQKRYIPQEVKNAILKRYFNMCAVCPETQLLEFHHKKEFSNGGDNSEQNIAHYHHSLITRYPPTREIQNA